MQINYTPGHTLNTTHYILHTTIHTVCNAFLFDILTLKHQTGWHFDILQIFSFWYFDILTLKQVANNNSWHQEFARANVKIRYGKWFFEVRVIRAGKAEVGWCTSKFKRVCVNFFIFFYFLFICFFFGLFIFIFFFWFCFLILIFLFLVTQSRLLRCCCCCVVLIAFFFVCGFIFILV